MVYHQLLQQYLLMSHIYLMLQQFNVKMGYIFLIYVQLKQTTRFIVIMEKLKILNLKLNLLIYLIIIKKPARI